MLSTFASDHRCCQFIATVRSSRTSDADGWNLFTTLDRLTVAVANGDDDCDNFIQVMYCHIELRKLSKKCVSKTHIRQTRGGGAVTTMCNTPVSRATSPSLIVCLYLAYCRLLKLTLVSNAGSVYKKLISSVDKIGERYLLNHAIVVYLYHPYTQFSRNVRLMSSANRYFSENRDFLILRLIKITLAYLFSEHFLVNNIYGSFINNTCY